jgi:hypothetical protein
MQTNSFAQNVRSQLKLALFSSRKGNQPSVPTVTPDEINSASLKKKDENVASYPS